MFFDNASLAAVRGELQTAIGARLERVSQHSRTRFGLKLHKPQADSKLLIALDPQGSRVHLTEQLPPALPQPSPFCLLLRKHLEAGKLECVTQPDRERVLILRFDAPNLVGDRVKRDLVIEIMGRYSRLILVDPESNLVIGIDRPVTEEQSRHRVLDAGYPYQPPPQVGPTTTSLSEEEFYALLLKHPEQPVGKLLQKHVFGLSRQAIQWIFSHPDQPAGDVENPSRRFERLQSWQQALDRGHFQWQGKQLIPAEGPCPVSGELERRLLAEEEQHTCQLLKKQLSERLETLLAKLKHRQNELVIPDDRESERLRHQGELLKANLWQLEGGETAIEVIDWESNDRVVLPLDPLLTPAENAQRLFKRAQRAHSQREASLARSKDMQEEIAYLESVHLAIDEATSSPELAMIREELEHGGYLPGSGGGKTSPERMEKTMLRYRSSDGFDILVGKNNRQNDHLVMQMARPQDWWLHAQNIPGSHVIVRAQGDLPERTLYEAAQLAAYFSRARGAGQVPVACTLRKHVKKPKGAKPGGVIYSRERVVMAVPELAPHMAEGSHA